MVSILVQKSSFAIRRPFKRVVKTLCSTGFADRDCGQASTEGDSIAPDESNGLCAVSPKFHNALRFSEYLVTLTQLPFVVLTLCANIG